MKKILISACFLGEKVRYDGQTNTLLHKIILQWKNEDRLISICPEVVGGLAIPRDPAEIKQATEIQVITQQGDNVTDAFYRGANAALSLCLQNKICFALLKESSPSCGSSTIYDGSFSKIKMKGEGITTGLLRKHGIAVFSENNIESLIKKLSIY